MVSEGGIHIDLYGIASQDKRPSYGNSEGIHR